jgi:3-oxoacyl-[acyl-carrier protein] reductase
MVTEQTGEMQDRVVLVTGASRGIGAATARLFGAHGATVCVNYHRSYNAAQEVVRSIEQTGGHAVAFQADVGNIHQIEAMVEAVEQALGPIETLVMNATALKQFTCAPFNQFSWDQFQAMVLGELAGVFVPARVIAPRMIQRQRGTMIAVSSLISRCPVEGFAAHAAGKAGVDALARVLATELGPHGIRVNVVAPGLVETEATRWLVEAQQDRQATIPLRRIAQPDDIAGAIYLLASAHAQFLMGNYLALDGGSSMP